MRLVIHRSEAILLGSVMLLSGAVIPSSWEPPVQTLPRPEINLPPKHPWIALTFDDGPHPVMTEKLLKVLQDEQVPATFFVVGKMVDRYPQVVQEMAQQGHEVANHTYSHPKLSRLGHEAVLNELAQTRTLIRRLTGHDSQLYRPPGGDYTRDILRTTSQAGYRMVLWSVLTKDVHGATCRAIKHRILQGAVDGSIVLMHSGMPNTVDVLPEVIAELRTRGFHFVTVSTLMGLPAPDRYVPPEAPTYELAAKPSALGYSLIQ